MIGGVGLFALWLLLRRLLSPLKALEVQARALGQRDFRKRVEVRSTRELNQVTEAMNQMADDLGQLFEGQGKLIQHLRKVNNDDPVTGLASRSAFDQRLKVEVESEEKAAPGVLLMIQLGYFADYNRAYGLGSAPGVSSLNFAFRCRCGEKPWHAGRRFRYNSVFRPTIPPPATVTAE